MDIAMFHCTLFEDLADFFVAHFKVLNDNVTAVKFELHSNQCEIVAAHDHVLITYTHHIEDDDAVEDFVEYMTRFVTAKYFFDRRSRHLKRSVFESYFAEVYGSKVTMEMGCFKLACERDPRVLIEVTQFHVPIGLKRCFDLSCKR